MRIIFPHVMRDALGLASFKTLFDRRQAQTIKMFQDISNNPEHKLHIFLPKPNQCCFNLKKKKSRRYHVRICKTNRLKKNFFYSNCI